MQMVGKMDSSYVQTILGMVLPKDVKIHQKKDMKERPQQLDD
jgi:hypothetical protein